MATAAGHEILAMGGNAFDAAVAVSATLAVVEPYSSGMGGGGFWLLHQADSGKTIMVDGREMAPARAHATMFLNSQGEVVPGASLNGPLSAAIPGQPATLAHVAARYGRLPLRESLAPAIRAARNGFEVTELYRRMVRFRRNDLRKSPAAAAIFLHNNDVPAVGYRVRQPDLAHMLNRLAEHGADGFYRGDFAKRLANGVRDAGGVWSKADLRNYAVKEREPVRFRYGSYDVVSAAPPSSGGTALATILNTYQQLQPKKTNRVGQIHLLVESMRRAFRDRAEYLGDPDFVDVPVSRLTSVDYARDLAQTVDRKRATPSDSLRPVVSLPSGRHTSHFSIIDRDGNRVAVTLSINYPFGSCFVPPGTGVLLNDEMDDFSAKPENPNAYGLVGASANRIEPGKRMLSSMSPTIIEGPDRLAIVGTPGGSRIITMVAHAILGVAAGETADAIVTRPRYHHQYRPDAIQYEYGALSDSERQKLQDMGHRLSLIQGGFGNMQIVIWDKKTNRVTAASDPRGDGRAEVR